MKLKPNWPMIERAGIAVAVIAFFACVYFYAQGNAVNQELAELESQAVISEIPGEPYRPDLFMKWNPETSTVSIVITEDLEVVRLLDTDLEVLHTYHTHDIHVTVPELAWIIRTNNTAVSFEDCETIANEIIYQSNQHKFTDADLPYLLALLWSESHFLVEAKNPASSASGVGQLLRMHWEPGQDPFEPAWNVARSIEIMAAHYNADWPVYMRWRHIMDRYTGGTLGGLLYVSKFQEELK